MNPETLCALLAPGSFSDMLRGMIDAATERHLFTVVPPVSVFIRVDERHRMDTRNAINDVISAAIREATS